MGTSRTNRREFPCGRGGGCKRLILAPALVRQDASRPALDYGTASGDITHDRAISEPDRPAARMLVEWSTTESFQIVSGSSPAIGSSSDFHARVELADLPGSQRIFYRVQFEDLIDARSVSIAATESSCRARTLARVIRLSPTLWGRDGVSPSTGAVLRMYD